MLPTVMRCEKSASVPRLSSHLWNMRLSWADTGVENRPWPVTSLQPLGHQIFCPHSLFLLVSIYNRKDTRSVELYFYIVPKRFQGIPNTGGLLPLLTPRTTLTKATWKRSGNASRRLLRIRILRSKLAFSKVSLKYSRNVRSWLACLAG
jgi:hypothetical protein